MSEETLPADAPQTTQLTVAERATSLLKATKREAELIVLANAAKTITAITNKDGYEEANRQRITLKKARIDVSKSGKSVRDDMNALGKAISAEEERLIEIISPEEKRLEALQEEFDTKAEAERQRLIDLENARVQRIKDGIEALRKFPLDAINKSSAEVQQLIESCKDVTLDEETFAEHVALARMVKGDSLLALDSQLTAAIDREQEAERIRLERIELEQLRENKRKQDAENARREQADRDAQAQRDREQKAEQDRQANANRAEEQRNADLQAESDRLTQELELLRKSNEERIAREQDEERQRLEREANAPADVIADEQAISETLDRPSDTEILEVIADHFDVSQATAFEWITSISSFQPYPKGTA